MGCPVDCNCKAELQASMVKLARQSLRHANEFLAEARDEEPEVIALLEEWRDASIAYLQSKGVELA